MTSSRHQLPACTSSPVPSVPAPASPRLLQRTTPPQGLCTGCAPAGTCFLDMLQMRKSPLGGHLLRRIYLKPQLAPIHLPLTSLSSLAPPSFTASCVPIPAIAITEPTSVSPAGTSVPEAGASPVPPVGLGAR